MRVVLFGASGMVGQGVLRECLLDPQVEDVLSIGRRPVERHAGWPYDKLRERSHEDFGDFSAIAADLAGHDACFYCLGVSSAGMSEADYRRVTYDYAVAVGKAMAGPALTFIYVSGASTDTKSRSMWARVKGETEDALFAMPFKAAYAFRPGLIQPLHGIRSKTKLYSAVYTVMRPLFPLVKAISPRLVTTTEAVGRAMIRVGERGADRKILENDDINRLAAKP